MVAVQTVSRFRRRRVPIGVIGIIYESRPNVTSDAASLCLKAGNAVILRGGSEAIRSNMALAEAVSEGCKDAGLPEYSVQLVPSTDRAAVTLMAQLDRYIHLIIPTGWQIFDRGGDIRSTDAGHQAF